MESPKEGAEPLAPPTQQSLASALSEFPAQVSKTFSVEFSALSPTVSPPPLVSVERTPAGHFGIFPLPVEKQNQMVDLACANGPKPLGTPGLLAFNFHRSLDGERVLVQRALRRWPRRNLKWRMLGPTHTATIIADVWAVAEPATGIVLNNCGHFVPEERPKPLAEAPIDFFREKRLNEANTSGGGAEKLAKGEHHAK